MRSIPFVLLFATVALSFTACTGPRYAASSEYDDVYFTKADIAAPVAVNNNDTDNYDYDRQPQRFQREPVDSYRDHYYADDDFTFSRRIRRFNQSNRNSWRYYDPYYSNDLYYVINSPSWNTWNGNGWYNWNSPRFGSYYSAYNDPFAFSYSPYRSWGALNTWSSFAYDPFIGAYYGVSPYGSPFYSPFNSPFGYSAFGAGYGAGFGAGFNSAYYCPPVGFVPANSAWNRNRRFNNNSQSYVSRARNTNTTTGNRPSTRNAINNTRPNSVATQTRRSNPNNSQYLQPRTRTASSATRTTTRPGRTAGTNNINRNRTTTSRQGTTTSPRTYTRSNRSVTNSNRSSSRANRYNNTTRTRVPNQNYSTPRNSSRSYNTSPRTNSGFNNSNRSFNTSPRSSSPSMNRSSGSRSTSTRSSSSGVRRR